MKMQLFILSIAVFLSLSAGNPYAQRMSVFSEEVDLTDQESLEINMKLNGGKVWFTKSPYDKLFMIEVEYNSEEMRPRYRYDEDDPSLSFRLLSKDEEFEENDGISIEFDDGDLSIGLSSFKKTSWDLKFTDKVPLKINLFAGATKGNFDFTGMMISYLNIETGASKTFISFDEPNPIRMSEFKLSIGLAKFRGKHLLNANFKKMTIEGGLGKSTLDFTGETTEKCYVQMELGISSTIIILPRNIGVKIYADVSAFTSFDTNDLIEVEDDVYESPNWGETEGELVMDIEASIGFVEFIFED
ncbi:MAG: hypothetical protein IIB94_07565 [Candidatus Marinimicrobia bacterium]|nr:hypothetical protein [Candidatus Neomarinimicrobiota bacterium]